MSIDTTMVRIAADAATKLGSTGKDAFVWYLIADKLLPFILGGVSIFLLYRVIMKGSAMLSGYTAMEDHFKRWRIKLGTGCSGHLTTGEMQDTAAAIDRLITKSRESSPK